MREIMRTAIAACLLVCPLAPAASPGIEEARQALVAEGEDAPTLLRLAALLRGAGLEDESLLAYERAAAAGADVDLLVEASERGVRCEGCERGGIGPDVIVGRLSGLGTYGSTMVEGEQIQAFSIGTTSCNVGDEPLSWAPTTNQHPVIMQNMYRLKDGRFEQIGQSWLKHGFATVNGMFCSDDCVPPPPPTPLSEALGVNCSDPYAPVLNGTQASLGPRWQVNASTGEFPFPWDPEPPPAPQTIGRRVQVKRTDLDPALNPGALYVAEGGYVHPEDAAHGNAMNNVSYRFFTFNFNTTSGLATGLTFPSQTVQTLPAIYAWQAVDPVVAISIVDVADDGRFVIGSRATDVGGGMWAYEYAVYNMNSHRSARSFTVPVPSNVSAGGAGFHDVPYHSGDGVGNVDQDGTDWAATITPGAGGSIRWETATIEENANANALRFGTLYNFRFTASEGPDDVVAVIGLFRPGEGAGAEGTVRGPACLLLGDYDGDGDVDFADLNLVISGFNGQYNFSDLNNVLSAFNTAC